MRRTIAFGEMMVCMSRVARPGVFVETAALNRRRFLQLSAGATLAGVASKAFAFGPHDPLTPPDYQWMTSQVGYLPQAAKVATLQWAAHASGHARSFRVLPVEPDGTTGRRVHQGTISAAARDGLSGDRVQLADFSAVKEPGRYRLEVEHGDPAAGSLEFAVGGDVLREPLRLATRAYYGQRCGCAVNLGGGYEHPPCHLKDGFDATSGKTGTFQNYGGWHDAGDYGRYIVNSGISTGTLLWAWEMYREQLQPMQLQIPESGGRTPDFLSEVRWNLTWMQALQDKDGGVWDKQTSLHFCGFIMPQDDQLVSYVIGSGKPPYKVATASADFSAVMAIAARVYREFDPVFADTCLDAAKRAWAWAMAHKDALFLKNPPTVSTGAYGDAHDSDELLWASAELWRTTGDARYEAPVLQRWRALTQPLEMDVPSWGNVASMAWWTYAMAEQHGRARGDAKLVAQIHASTLGAAEGLVKQSRKNGYGQTLAEADYEWGSNGVAGNQGLLLLMAHRFHPQGEYREAARGNLHYLLGRNCFGVSWVTHVGTNPFQHPHHRPSVADGIAAPWPGLLSGGPNRHPGDPVAKTLPPMPPMRMWIDDWQAFSMNEVAINWNAPLVFTLAGVQE
jgi:endoglucanase